MTWERIVELNAWMLLDVAIARATHSSENMLSTLAPS